MPLEELTNIQAAPDQSAVLSSKRVHDVAADASESESEPPPEHVKKKARVSSLIFEPKPKPDLTAYIILPAPTTSYIQLRFQLARFKGVYRIARLPLTFTFANLHKFIMASVYVDIVIYARTNKPSEIRKCGRTLPVPDGWVEDRMCGLKDETIRETIRHWALVNWENETGGSPEFKAVAQGKVKGRSYGFKEYMKRDRREDQNVTLSDVWNLKTGSPFKQALTILRES